MIRDAIFMNKHIYKILTEPIPYRMLNSQKTIREQIRSYILLVRRSQKKYCVGYLTVLFY